jgi:hypothetical protein
VLQQISPERLAATVTEQVYERAVDLSRDLGASIGKPQSPPIAAWVGDVVRYAQAGNDALSNDDVTRIINSLLRVLSATCYRPATTLAETLWDRRAGEPATEIELVLLAARARWGIEIAAHVPIRWLAPLGGVSVKTARNLASQRTLTTRTTSKGQVCAPREAARWLSSRGIEMRAGWRA